METVVSTAFGFFVVWLAYAGAVGVLAEKVGRNGWLWMLFALVMSPPFAMLGLIAVGRRLDG